MPSLADLHRAVQTALSSGRIGQPVFVRYVLFVKSLNPYILSGLASVVRDWFGEAPEQLHAIGNDESGHVSLSLRFTGGASALVSVARCHDSNQALDLTILGNRGAIYHESTLESMDDSTLPVYADIVKLMDQAQIRHAHGVKKP